LLARRIRENRSTLRANAEDADGLPCRHLRIGVMIVVIVAYVMFGPFRGDIVLVFGASAIFYVSGTFAFPVRSS